MLALMLAFALQQAKTKNHSGIIQARGYLPHMDTFGPAVKALDPD